MKVILLSGGTGKRLWPLSQETYSKQYLKIFKDSSGNQISMIQNTVNELKRLNLQHDTLAITSGLQFPVFREQIGTDIACIAEPERRDTFPAIALASAYLHSESLAPSDEIIIVLPVDANAAGSFYDRLTYLAEALKESPSFRIGLIGVKPTNPSEEYGYIRVRSAEKYGLMRIEGFIEKPTRATATQLIQEQALWNSGVFAFRLDYMLRSLSKRNLPQEYAELFRRFLELPARSFDYEVLEQEPHIGCLEYVGEWRDMGNWNAITDMMHQPLIGKGFMDDNCEGTYVLN